MSKQTESPMILRAIGQARYVNVGGGNITMVAESLAWNGTPGIRISFVGGDSTLLEDEVLEIVVDRLRREPGFGR